MSNGKSFTVTMEEDLVQALDRRARGEERSRNYIINKLCKNFLSKGALHHEGEIPSPRHAAEGRSKSRTQDGAREARP